MGRSMSNSPAFLVLVPLLVATCGSDERGETSATGQGTQTSTDGATSTSGTGGTSMTVGSGPETETASDGTVGSTTASEPAEVCKAFAEHLVMCDPDEAANLDQYKEQCLADLQAALEADGVVCADAQAAVFECLTKAPCDSPGGDCIAEFDSFNAACPNLGGLDSTT